MKKKQILFLFAASALFAACSSDELPGNNGDNTGNGDENMAPAVTATSTSVTTEEGFGMTVGATAGTKAATKADSESDSFTLNLPDDIIGDWEGYIAEADDFNITLTENNKKEVLKATNDGQSTSYGKIKVTRGNDLSVTIDGLHQLKAYNPGEVSREYTFEVYIWINNQVVDIHTGADGVWDIYGDGFTYNEKLSWIGLSEGTTVNEKTERGKDFTDQITSNDYTLTKKVIGDFNGNQNYRYIIRYNVYRGLQGTQYDEEGKEDTVTGLGNTPYIKVSIHVNRLNYLTGPDEIIAVLPK